MIFARRCMHSLKIFELREPNDCIPCLVTSVIT